MALKTGSRSSFCPNPVSALGAQLRLWSGQTHKNEHTDKSRNPCQSHYQRSRLAKFWMRKGKYREMKSPAKPFRRGQSPGFLKSVILGLQSLPHPIHLHSSPCCMVRRPTV